MASETLEELAKVHHLPSDEELALDAQETLFYAHFRDNPGGYFALIDKEGHLMVDDSGAPIFDPVALKAYEQDLQQMYDKIFRERTSAKPRRRFKFNDLGLKLAEVCIEHPMPIVETIPSHINEESNHFPFKIARALSYDLRYAAKLAQNDAQEYKRLVALQKPKFRTSTSGAIALSLSMMAASFAGAFLGMGLAVDQGIDRAKTEFRQETNRAINQAKDELRDELDDAVEDYSWGYFRPRRSQPASNENSNKPKPPKKD